MSPDRQPVAVVVGATSKWQADGRNTRLAHGKDLDDRHLPVGVRWGVGGAIAQKFAKEGFLTVLTTRKAANAAALEQAITSQGGRAMTVELDLVSDASIAKAFATIRERAGDPDEIAKAVPLTGRAGSMSFHHVRLLHGSAQNVSRLPRALLLYEYAATDAWPLMGVKDLAEFDARLVAGPPTLEPRVTPVPVRIPLPPARNQGSIYENQTAARRFFSFTEEAEAPSRT